MKAINLRNFLKYFIVLPTFFLGIHLGIIIIHIITKFSFDIPIFVRITGILSGMWVLLSIVLFIKVKFNHKAMINDKPISGDNFPKDEYRIGK